MAGFYDPLDWYWSVNGDAGRVYSTARADFVPINDAAFVAWSAAQGKPPSRVDTQAALADVLANTTSPPPANGALLASYHATRTAALMRDAYFKVLFNHENRIRTLEGKVALTPAQAAAAFEALLP